MLSFSAMPLMAFPLGKIADHLGVTNMFIVQGAIVVGIMGLMALLNPGHTFGRMAPGSQAPQGFGRGRTPTEDALPAGGK
jgi:hypothetical protein